MHDNHGDWAISLPYGNIQQLHMSWLSGELPKGHEDNASADLRPKSVSSGRHACVAQAPCTRGDGSAIPTDVTNDRELRCESLAIDSELIVIMDECHPHRALVSQVAMINFPATIASVALTCHVCFSEALLQGEARLVVLTAVWSTRSCNLSRRYQNLLRCLHKKRNILTETCEDQPRELRMRVCFMSQTVSQRASSTS